MLTSPQSLANARQSGFGSREDIAAFNRETLRRIWGENPNCLLITCDRADDFHHIVGRHGGKQNRALRVLYSSPYNACPLSRRAHTHCALLSAKGMQEALLSAVYKHIQNAINKGFYETTELDREFLRKFLFRN